MLRADTVFYNQMLEVYGNGTTDKGGEVRPHYKDGTPAHTKYILDVFETYDISKGELPITTLRPIAIKSSIGEILWIYQDQSTDLDLLRDKYGITWWDEWDIGDRTIGNTYGAIVRQYNMIDRLIEGIKTNPFSRYHMMNLWQEENFTFKHGLKPCAFLTMWGVRHTEDGHKYLDLLLVQRSNDYLVSGHINMMQYVCLQYMIAKATGYEVGKFSRMTKNLHYYDRHEEQLKELIKRYNDLNRKEQKDWIDYRSRHFQFSGLNNNEIRNRFDEERQVKPKLEFNTSSTNFYDFKVDDFKLVDYNPITPQLKFEIAI